MIDDEDLLLLIIFDRYAKRLIKFARPLQRPPGLSITLSPKSNKSKICLTNTPSELKFSALLNSLRPLTLTDGYAFLNVRNRISSYYHSVDDNKRVRVLRDYKKTWTSLTDKTSEHKITMQGILSINGPEITTYAELLDYFIYGKYVHSAADKFIIVSCIENNPLLYAQARMNIGECIYALSEILRDFSSEHVSPIIKEHASRIKNILSVT